MGRIGEPKLRRVSWKICEICEIPEAGKWQWFAAGWCRVSLRKRTATASVATLAFASVVNDTAGLRRCALVGGGVLRPRTLFSSTQTTRAKTKPEDRALVTAWREPNHGVVWCGVVSFHLDPSPSRCSVESNRVLFLGAQAIKGPIDPQCLPPTSLRSCQRCTYYRARAFVALFSLICILRFIGR